MTLTLKRGSGRTFDGANWKLAADKKWGVHLLLVPGGKEEYLGARSIDGVEHAVFRCLNDEFFAQPTKICQLPAPKDPGEVVYSLEPQEEAPKKKSQTIQSSKALCFAGKNWKLAADKKWKSSTNFHTPESTDKVGEKKIGQTTYDVYRSSTGFMAIKQ